MPNYKLIIVFVTIYLVVFTLLTRTNLDPSILFLMFSLSPFLMIWMVLSILMDGKHSGKKLGPDEEWGYEDIEKDQLGTF